MSLYIYVKFDYGLSVFICIELFLIFLVVYLIVIFNLVGLKLNYWLYNFILFLLD